MRAECAPGAPAVDERELDQLSATCWRVADATELAGAFAWTYFTADKLAESRRKLRRRPDPRPLHIAATVIRDHLPVTYDTLSAHADRADEN